MVDNNLVQFVYEPHTSFLFAAISFRLSQPFRIDLQIEVESVSINKLTKANRKDENSKMIKYRVKKARVLQYKRQGKINAHLENHDK